MSRTGEPSALKVNTLWPGFVHLSEALHVVA
jgi:hypothetical protein